MLGLALAVPSLALAASAVVSRDGKRTLISRDIGAERWAITQNSAEDGTVTGNVFRADGGDPQFVWCEDISVEGESETTSLRCYGADRCLASPCTIDEWTFISDVPLPTSFFAAEGDVRWESAGPPVTLPFSFFSPPVEAEEGAAGVQITRDGARTLINKDVGAARWAITRNPSDGTVTGNVFDASGAEPSFLWCEEVSRAADELTLSCFIAVIETFGPIPDGPGNFFVDRRLGDDENPGTRGLPFRSIQGAIDRVADLGGGDVYVAGGVYPETVVLSSRVNLFGSFDATDWVRNRETSPTIVEGRADATFEGEPVDGAAVVGVGIAVATLDGFTLAGADATEPSRSSVAVNLSDARVVTLSRNTILAGRGAPGTSGEDGAPGVRGENGGAGENAAACPPSRDGGAPGEDGGFDGGRGGTGGAAVGFAGSAGNGLGSDGGFGGRGGDVGQDGGSGGRGGNGRSGESGDGGLGFGSLGATESNLAVYVPADGEPATDGGPGSGGGGGGGGGGALVFACGGGGGGGGAGGTGGGAGTLATGGGASIAVLVARGSDVEIRDNLVSTAGGGAGADGGLGASGGAGGSGGRGGSRFGAQGAGGSGGDGRFGGPGGDGGSGGGGPSVGIVVDGESVAIASGNSFDVGEGGAGALREGAPQTTEGAAGVEAELLELPLEG